MEKKAYSVVQFKLKQYEFEIAQELISESTLDTEFSLEYQQGLCVQDWCAYFAERSITLEYLGSTLDFAARWGDLRSCRWVPVVFPGLVSSSEIRISCQPEEQADLLRDLELGCYRLELARFTPSNWQVCWSVGSQEITFKSRQEQFICGRTSSEHIALVVQINGILGTFYLSKELYQFLLNMVRREQSAGFVDKYGNFYLNWLVEWLNQNLLINQMSRILIRNIRVVHAIKQDCIWLNASCNSVDCGYLLTNNCMLLPASFDFGGKICNPIEILKLPLAVGKVELTMTEINDLSPGDVVVLDTAYQEGSNKLVNLVLDGEMIKGHLLTHDNTLKFCVL